MHINLFKLCSKGKSYFYYVGSFNHLFFTPLVRDVYGDGQTQDTHHGIDEMHNNLLVTYTHDLEDKGTTCPAANTGLHKGIELIIGGCGRQALWYQEGEVPPGSCGKM